MVRDSQFILQDEKRRARSAIPRLGMGAERAIGSGEKNRTLDDLIVTDDCRYPRRVPGRNGTLHIALICALKKEVSASNVFFSVTHRFHRLCYTEHMRIFVKPLKDEGAVSSIVQEAFDALRSCWNRLGSYRRYHQQSGA